MRGTSTNRSNDTMRSLSFAVSALAFAGLTACAQTSTAPANAASATGVARTTLPSGVIFESVQTGSGASPKATDTVKVHYRGTLTDGKEFDSSYKRGQPAS